MITKDTIPWRIQERNPASRGVLSQSQISHLCSVYNFETDAVYELSIKLETALSPTLNITQPELRAYRIAKGSKELESVITNLEAAELRLAKTAKTLEDLTFKNLFSHTGLPNPSISYFKELAECREMLSHIRHYMEVSKREESALYKGIPDKRRMLDMRRNVVCMAIFSFWSLAGRKLTYTTDPINNSRRGGPLIDFTNAVVECITNPPHQLSGEAIKTELEDFKSFGTRTS